MSKKKTKVLIVESEALSARKLERCLTNIGYETITSVDSIDAAVLKTGKDRPCIALMDIRFRGERDGTDIAAEMRDRYGIPVVFYAANTDTETRAAARDASTFDVLVKPFRKTDLQLAVELALVKHQKDEELRRANECLERKVLERTEELARTVEELQQEIADRKQAETALRESEAKFRCLVDWANDGIVIVDAATRIIVEVNMAICDMLGYSREELLGFRIDDIHPSQDLPLVLSEFQDAVRNGRKRADNLPVMRKDGSVFYADVSHATVLLDGRPHGMGIFRDTTERKRAEDIIQVRLKLMDYAATHSLDDLLQKTLDEVGELTGSPIGFYHFLEPDQRTLSLQAWSTRTVRESCAAEGKGRHYSIEDAGVWVDCVHQRKPVIHNDYAALSHRKGMPPGHAVVTRELVVPVFRDDKIVAILGVGNKPREYIQQDVDLVVFLADVAWEITARKRAEEGLRAVNSRFEFLISTSPAVIYTCRHGGDWAATFMSENLQDILGYSAQKHLTTPNFWLEHIHPDDRERVLAGLSALETAEFYTHEYRFMHRDGTYRWMFDRLRVVRNEQGVPIECVGSWMDITDRKIAEERLLLLHKAVSTSRAGITFRDAANMIVFTNAAEARMHGYEQSELIGKPAHLLSPPQFRFDMTVERMRTIDGWERESMNIRKDGTIFPVHLASEIVKDEQGSPLGIVTVCEDISDRKRIENELKVYEQIVKRMAEGVVLTRSADRTIVYTNPAFEQIFGYGPGELVGMDVSVLNAGGSEAPFEIDIQRSLKTTGFWNGTLQNIRKDGSLFWSQVTVVTFSHPRFGEVWLGVQQDISERKKAEAAIDDYRKQLEDMVTDRTRELQDTISQLHDEINEREKLTGEIHRSKLFLSNILNSIQDGICVLDTNRRIMLVNSAVAKWVPEAEHVGFRTHTCGDLYHKLGRCDECIAESEMKTDSMRTMIFPGGGNEKKWFEIHSYPLHAENGAIIGCVEYIREVTAAQEMKMRITQYQEQLRMLNYEMAALENREQRRIAQELHDSIPQTLAFCRMRLEGLERRLQNAAPPVQENGLFREIYGLLDNSIAEARSLIFKLAPPVLYELGLEPALQQLLNQIAKTHPIGFEFKSRGRRAPLLGEGAAIVYGMVRELLVNCIKHSGADAVTVSIERCEGDLVIKVQDNGRGLGQDPGEWRIRSEDGGFGLFSIRERVRHMEGVFTVENNEGTGACATIRVPLPRIQRTMISHTGKPGGS